MKEIAVSWDENSFISLRYTFEIIFKWLWWAASPPFPPSCCQERDSTYNNNLFYVGFAGIAVKVLLSSGGKKYWTLHELSSSTWVSPMLIGIFNRLRKKRKERSYSVETIRICQFDPVSHELQKREKKISPCVGTLKILFRNVQKILICVAGSH